MPSASASILQAFVHSVVIKFLVLSSLITPIVMDEEGKTQRDEATYPGAMLLGSFGA